MKDIDQLFSPERRRKTWTPPPEKMRETDLPGPAHQALIKDLQQAIFEKFSGPNQDLLHGLTAALETQLTLKFAGPGTREARPELNQAIETVLVQIEDLAGSLAGKDQG